MHKGDTPPINLPSAVKELGIKPIPWDQKEINKAVDKAAQ